MNKHSHHALVGPFLDRVEYLLCDKMKPSRVWAHMDFVMTDHPVKVKRRDKREEIKVKSEKRREKRENASYVLTLLRLRPADSGTL